MPNERDQGRVEAIYLAVDATGEPEPVEEAEAVPGRGLRGDRYFDGSGTFFEPGKSGQDLTLVEAEAIEGMAESGIEIEPGESRRNVLTRGIDLNALVGERFRVGEVECRGDRLCDPCAHLQRLTKPGVLKGLANRGGLRADVLTGGRIRVGDSVSPPPQA
jgi:MOSC domain-containing protein YiiM